MIIEIINRTLDTIIAKFVTGVIIIMLAIVVGNILKSLIIEILKRTILWTQKRTKSLSILLASLVKYFIIAAGIIAGLDSIGLLNLIIKFVIAVFVLLTIIYAILIAVDFLPEVISKRKMNLYEGQKIKRKNIKGIIVKKRFTSLLLRTDSDELLLLRYTWFKNP